MKTKMDKGSVCWVIVNKGSGSVAEIYDNAFEEQLVTRLRDNGWEPEIHLVEGDEIDDTLSEAKSQGIGTIICAGGDGTINGVAAKLAGSDTTLGLIPFGTLNLVARDLESPLEPLEAAERLVPGRTRSIGTLEVNQKVCLCVTFFGFYPLLLKKSEEVHSDKWWMKFLRMGKQLVRAYDRSKRLLIELDTQEGNRTLSTRLLALVPGDFEDAFGLLPKRKGLESGFFHVYSSNHETRWSIVRLAFNMLFGSPDSDPNFTIVKTRECRVNIKKRSTCLVAIDGETLNLDLPVDIRMHQQLLTVLDPRPEEEEEEEGLRTSDG